MRNDLGLNTAGPSRPRATQNHGDHLLPVRFNDSSAGLVEVCARSANLYEGLFWEKIDNDAKAPPKTFGGGDAFRTVDLPGMVLYIRPPNGDTSDTKHNGISWKEVQGAFGEVAKKNKLHTRYILLLSR